MTATGLSRVPKCKYSEIKILRKTGIKAMLCYVMWNLFTIGSLQFPNDSTIASLEVLKENNDSSFKRKQ